MKYADYTDVTNIAYFIAPRVSSSLRILNDLYGLTFRNLTFNLSNKKEND